MKRFSLRLMLFLLPFFGIILAELSVLPIDFSTFRVWEALRIHSLKWVLPGYFYPHVTVTKTETGDLAAHSPYATKKTVTWVTDRYGYRNRDLGGTAYKVVVIGDSNVAGSGLTQGEIISEALSRDLGTPVYNLSPASINTFLKDLRFMDRPPQVVIVASIEREITTLRRAKKELVAMPWYEKAVSYGEFRIKENPVIQAIAMPIDRFLKGNLLHFSRASLRRAITRWAAPIKERWADRPSADKGDQDDPLSKGSLVFVQGIKANDDVPTERSEETVRLLASYRDILKTRGIRFIFLPIPNKENTYYNLLPVKKKPIFLEHLIPALNRTGVETVDTQRAFDHAAQQGILVFQPDDSHWNGKGVAIAARLLAQRIQNP